MKTWKIAYTIVEGEHEYGDYILREAEHLTKADVAAIVAAFWCGDCGPEEEARFLQELTDDGYAALPSCGRCITDLGWEAVSPIVVTVRNGFVESVAGVPVDVTVEVQDWDNGEARRAGRAGADGLGMDGAALTAAGENWEGAEQGRCLPFFLIRSVRSGKDRVGGAFAPSSHTTVHTDPYTAVC